MLARYLWRQPRIELDEVPPPLHSTPQQALELSQQATNILQSAGTAPFDDTTTWTAFETLLYSCLRTEDDKSAHICLERLTTRFGVEDARVMGLKGMYDEATARSDSELERILRRYESVIQTDPTNIPIAKRRVGLLKSMGRNAAAIQGLIDLLAMSPTDAEAWTEAAELYADEQQFRQAIYCLEEVVLITPNSWNTWARLGEIYFTCTKGDWLGKEFDPETCLSLSIRAYCRSLELCDDYIRALCGLKTVSRIFVACSSLLICRTAGL